METKIEGKFLVIKIDTTHVDYETEKTYMLASSHGWAPVGVVPQGRLKGRHIVCSLNCGVRK